jgi:hypothetical protein
MRYTLLQMTQSILSSMDSDQVNTINDTAESQQVADIIKTTYYDLLPSLNLPEHSELFELTATTSSTPVIMTLPTNVMQLDWLKYDCTPTGAKDFRQLDYWPLKDFLDSMHSLSSTASYVTMFTLTTNGSDSMDIMCVNNEFPSRYTTFNDNTLIFDSYDSTYDAFLQKNKTVAYGQTIPTWSATDGFTPDLDPKQFTLLLNEAKGQAFIELKQTVNAKAEKRARRGWINSQKTKENVSGTYQGKMTNSYNFGRK